MQLATATNHILQVEVASNFLRRFLGLMGRGRLAENRGLLLAPCNSIHMCFMRFSIDAIYLDREYRVLKVVRHLRPWIGLSMCRDAWATLELVAGTAECCGIEAGMQLSVIDG